MRIHRAAANQNKEIWGGKDQNNCMEEKGHEAYANYGNKLVEKQRSPCVDNGGGFLVRTKKN
jgi:hypothetical protein